MGKCQFNEAWLEREEFRNWLEAAAGDRYAARCKVCRKIIQLGTLGVKALESHAKAGKHQIAVKSSQCRQPISSFLSVSQPTSLPGPAVQHSPNNSQATFGSTETSKAEVLWILHTVTSHLSYNSSSNINGLFQAMFPDSTIAKTFACGPNKIAYIARFGLADFIKRELVKSISGQYVLMFDESFNTSTKSKQLDLHIRFWSNGEVQSRYMDSQFMGHGTAQDLLTHIQVSELYKQVFFYVEKVGLKFARVSCVLLTLS